MASFANSKGACDLKSILKSGNPVIAMERASEIFRTDCVDLNPMTLELQNNSAFTLSTFLAQPGLELETTNLIEKSVRFRHEIFA